MRGLEFYLVMAWTALAALWVLGAFVAMLTFDRWAWVQRLGLRLGWAVAALLALLALAILVLIAASGPGGGP